MLVLKTPTLLCASLTALGLALGSHAQAASSMFTGKNSGNWNNATSWLPEGGPAFGDDVVIADLTTNQMTMNDGPHTIGTLQFGATGTRANPAAGQFVINGNTSAAGAYVLTITNGVVANGNFNVSGTAGFQTKLPVTVQGDQTWSIGGSVGSSTADFGMMLTVGANGTQRPLVLNGKLIKTGPGQLGLVGQNVGDGDIIVNQGALKFNAGSSTMLTVGGTGSITVNNGAGLFIARNSGTLNITKAIVLNNGSTLRLGGNATAENFVGSPFTFNGSVSILGEYASLLLAFTNNWSGTLNATITGSGGTWTLYGNNSGLAGTLNNNGTVHLRLGTANSGSASVEWGLNNAAAYYDIYGSAQSVQFGALSGSAGTVRNSNTNGLPATLTVGALNTSTTFGGSLVNDVGELVLTKVGTGTLTLTGASTYTGNTVVSGGALLLQGSTASLGSANVQVAAGATFGGSGSAYSQVNVAAGGKLQADGGVVTTPLTVNGLALGAGAADQTVTRVNVYMGGKVVAGALTVNGQNTIDIIGTAPAVGVYDLITYSGTIGGGGFAGFRLGALPYGVVAHLENSGAAVRLNVTAVTAEPGIWSGAVAGAWNLAGGLEWKGANSGNPQAYHDLDVVTFDDSAAVFTVNLTENVNPTKVTVNNNAHLYTFSGPGAIAGNTTLLGKDGSGTLVLANANTFAGGSFITNGTLQLGAGGTNGSLLGPISDNGSLVLNRADALTLAGVISGTGSLEQRGPGVATLSGANVYAGLTTISGGTLAMGNGSALGDTNLGTVVAGGATLDLNSQSLGMEPVTAQGAGVDGAGALVNNGAADQTQGFRFLTLAGPTTFGGTHRWDIRDPATASDPNGGLNAWLQAGGFKVTKVNSNVVAFINIGETGLGDVDVQGGTLIFSRSSFMGNAARTVAVYPGATLQFHRTSEYMQNVLNKVVVMTNAILAVESNGLTNLFAGPVTFTGSNTVSLPSATGLELSGTLNGAGSMNISGGGTLILSGNGAYTGGTTLNGGVLQVDGAFGNGAFPFSPVGAALSGNGTIRDAVTIPAGSILSPGTVEPGRLTINNSLVLAAGSTNRFKINKDYSTNDLVQGLTSVTYGGTLVLTNTGYTVFAPGDSFKLFSAASYNGSFANVVPATPGVGLLWDTNSLRVNGTIKVLLVPTPRPLRVLGADSLVNPAVNVVFDVSVDPSTALDPANYTLSGTNHIVGIQIYSETNVELTLDYPLTQTNLTIQVKNVRDQAYVPNVLVTTNLPIRVIGFEQKAASVITNGSAYALGDKIKVYADGADIFDKSDQMEFVYKQVTNDFDFSVRVESMVITDPAAKAGIMAREISDPTSVWTTERFAMAASFTADPSRSQAFFQWREAADANAVALSSPRPAVTFPDNWIRLKRVGAVFSAYCSSNNVDWTFIGSLDTATLAAGSFAGVLRVGLAATSHNVASTTEVVFSQFGVPKNQVALTVTVVGPNVVLSWPASGVGLTLQTAASLTPPVTWTPVPGSTLTNQVQLPLSSGSSFFRLTGN